MIKLLEVKPLNPHVLELSFSDHSQGVFDGAAYLAARQGPPEFDTNRAKCLICIGQASRLPLQQAQLGVLLGFLDLECSQHIRLALGD